MEYSAEEYSMLMATNGNSAFHVCQLAYPLLKTSGGVGKHCVYFFRCWLGAHRFRIHNIRSNCVASFCIRTPLLEHVIFFSLTYVPRTRTPYTLRSMWPLNIQSPRPQSILALMAP
ncbi:hypothetical protein HYC85_000618 [Camellia sinensis]|uniref:Uncharacterized protein n=1 Tax=Camellia sinensis TaxID=4442 RepID=A0A7J7I395_CAMSI|nr:hypothetical protein HYC85_000618 [Camellia sinensis]